MNTQTGYKDTHFIRIFFLILFAVPAYGQEYTRIVAFGDSWTDDNRGTPWVEHLANTWSIPVTNRAVAGARSHQIDSQVNDAIRAGIDSNALFTYWIFPNDLLDYPNPFNAIPVIENNVRESFDKLRSAGAQHFLVLTLPTATTIPIFAAYGPIAIPLLDDVDAAVVRATGDVMRYDAGALLDQIESNGQGCWLDQQHFCVSTHIRVAQGVAGMGGSRPGPPTNLGAND